MNDKKDNAYKSIGEVAKLLNLFNKKTGKLSTHTIRFWEKKFSQIKPKIFSGKRRYYDNQSIETLKKIKFLLKDKGMTINGVKKLLLNKNSFDLDEISNTSINSKNINLKSKIEKISKLVKEIKKL
jgi:DNA-binding transcriptional MerR regulator|tara:strand:+ start:177 stop:554 length:378 start_codon:yes stop_codon:yes gene_type:complete